MKIIMGSFQKIMHFHALSFEILLSIYLHKCDEKINKSIVWSICNFFRSEDDYIYVDDATTTNKPDIHVYLVL